MFDELQQICREKNLDYDDVISNLSSVDTDAAYDEYLDGAYGPVVICGYSYSASYAFHEIDPIAYRCSFSDWLDSQSDVYIQCPHSEEYFLIEDVQELIDDLGE